jgi:tRNA(Ile)-lysidine synthase
LTNSNGDILWLVGERPDNRYRITAKTTTALTISMIRTDGM